MKKLFFIYFLIFNLTSCSQKADRSFENFTQFTWEDLPDAKEINGEKLRLDGFLDPRGLLYKEGMLVVSETSNEFQIHIYKEDENFRLVNSKGYNGFGPGELTNVRKMEDRGEPGKFWAYDLQQKSYYRFDLHDSSFLADKEYSRLEPFYYVADMTWASDSTVWANMVDHEDQYFELSIKGDTIATWGKWQDYADRPGVPSSVFSSLHQGKKHVNLSKRIGVVAGSQRDYIEIVDLETHEMIQISGPENSYPEYTVDYSLGYPMPNVNRNNKAFYLDSYPGDNYIYLLYFGEPGRKLGELGYNSKLFIMSYQGIIEKVYQFKQPIISMAIDEENDRMFGLSYEADPDVYLFNFK
ncbi:hypothetical protein PBT90_18335 [Algoriphagus halophytocola]|uniref:BF3164 family lipoprotein n=1 Tax=Algoriphagus halophytocola TaxID=2991499 RepID=UPI0022DD4894|nr:BF3164 family lipoprotein [Algoriphagus sp. TR-M9]WBL42688.1 hypothetical protein PBT90_18335 [Algoriphagus sp. TR-M9]